MILVITLNYHYVCNLIMNSEKIGLHDTGPGN